MNIVNSHVSTNTQTTCQVGARLVIDVQSGKKTNTIIKIHQESVADSSLYQMYIFLLKNKRLYQKK